MIEISNLSITFDGHSHVLDKMSLTIEDDKTTVVIGESGSGKSITILAILGILPTEAQVTGSIKHNGVELLTLSEKELHRMRGRDIGYIPQGGGNSMHPLITVGHQVAESVAAHQKIPKSKAFEKATGWLEKVGLKPTKEIADSYPHTLSGGMRQRALIAMGAAGGAKVLLADEPTKGLDDKRVAQIGELLKSLTEKTILCVTHDLRFAQEIADNVCVMYGGQVVEYAGVDSFFANPKHPYSQMLIASLPENGLNCPESVTPPNIERTGCSFYHRCPYKEIDCMNDVQMYRQGEHEVRCRLHVTVD